MAVRGKVLIVEDDRAICSFMRRVLEANGYESIIVGTGREALSMLTSHCPDVVILDLGLPDMDGMDVLTQLRAWSLMPVVVVSARTDEREKVRALDAGADDMQVEEETFEVYTDPDAFGSVLAALEEKGYTFVQAAVEMVPQNYVKLENEDDIKNMEKLIDLLEDNDDVQNVWHNWDQE